MATFGERLKIIMRERGITQKQLAQVLGTSHSLISEYIHNKKEPSIFKAVMIADFLGVDLHWLITGKYQNNGKTPKVQIKTGANSQVSSTEVNHVKGKNIIVSGIVELGEGRKTVKLNKSTQELLELINKLNPKQQKALKQFILTLLNSNMEE